MDATLLTLTADDWAILRDVRLRALADAPDAFGSTEGREAGFDEGEWRRRAGSPYPTVVVGEGSQHVAMGGVFLAEGTAHAQVWGMWTDPAARGKGYGSLVLAALLDWCAGRGVGVRLHVTVGNSPARSLYERHGFVVTGAERQELRPGSGLYAEELELRGQ